MNRIIYTSTLVLLLVLAGQSQIGRLPLSPVQKIEQNIAKTDITIEYSRPSKRDRDIFGVLVPYNQYWRTGANRNTTITFSEDVSIDETLVKKGKYAIITKPGLSSWEFLLYSDVNNWDVPEALDTSKIIVTSIVKPKQTNDIAESMSISIGDFTNYDFNLEIEWDNIRITVPIQLTTRKTMDSLIKDELEGPTSGDYYSAAVYQLESEKDYVKGLKWINQAIELREKSVWYDYRVKALLLLKLNRFDEIVPVIKLGSPLAEQVGSDYGINEFALIKELLD